MIDVVRKERERERGERERERERVGGHGDTSAVILPLNPNSNCIIQTMSIKIG